jgi:hypothetical protein
MPSTSSYEMLSFRGQVSAKKFEELFKDRLGDDYAKAADLWSLFGPAPSFALASALNLAIQKGNVCEVLAELDRWAEMAYRLPRPAYMTPVRVQFDQRAFFISMYQKYFADELPHLVLHHMLPPVIR